MTEELASALFGAQDDEELRQLFEDYMSQSQIEMSPEERAAVERLKAEIFSPPTEELHPVIDYTDGMVPLEVIVREGTVEHPSPRMTCQENLVTAALAALTDREAISIIGRAITASGLVSNRKLAKRVLECARHPGKEWADPEMVYAEGVLLRLWQVREVSK